MEKRLSILKNGKSKKNKFLFLQKMRKDKKLERKGERMEQKKMQTSLSEEEKEEALNYEVAANFDDSGAYEKRI